MHLSEMEILAPPLLPPPFSPFSFSLSLPPSLPLHQVLVLPFGIFSGSTWDLVSQPGIKPSPLHWEHRVSATGPPRKSSWPLLLTGYTPPGFMHDEGDSTLSTKRGASSRISVNPNGKNR